MECVGYRPCIIIIIVVINIIIIIVVINIIIIIVGIVVVIVIDVFVAVVCNDNANVHTCERCVTKPK